MFDVAFLKADIFNSNFWGKDSLRINVCYTQLPFSTSSDAVRQREVMLLPVPDQRPAVGVAADPLPHHLPPVELQAGVHRVHTRSGQVRAGPGGAGGP